MASENRLFRSTGDRVMFGVSGGMAEYFDLDPALVRVGWIAICLMTAGAAAVLYIAMIFLVPERTSFRGASIAEEQETDQPATGPTRVRRRNGFAWLLILGGFALFAANRGFLFNIPWSVVGPVALIALGFVLLARHQKTS